MEFIVVNSPFDNVASRMEEAKDEVVDECKKRARDADEWEDVFEKKKSSSAIQRTVSTEEDDEFLSTLLSEVSVTKSNLHQASSNPSPPKISTDITSKDQFEGIGIGNLSAAPCVDPITLSEPVEGRYQQQPPRIMVERWTCDVCKSCSFETFEEADIHETQCKLFHHTKMNSDGDKNEQMTTAWKCDICKSCSFETHEEAEVHETQCTILHEAKTQSECQDLKLRLTEAWTCDVCKSCSFKTFKDADIHETQCRILHDAEKESEDAELMAQTTEAADVLTSLAFCQPVQQETGGDFADSKLPAKRHPAINLVPMEDSRIILSDYNGLLIRNIEFYYPLTDNRVGLRCIHCKDHPQHVTAATFFPSSIGSISSGLGTIGARHFGWGKCPFIPPEIVQQMIETKKASGLQTKTNGRVGLDAYCKNLAQQYGIVNDYTSGISWIEGTVPNFDEVNEFYDQKMRAISLASPSSLDQSSDATDRNSIASVLASMKNAVNIETSPFVPSETAHFWECSGCRWISFDFRAKGSVVFSVAEPTAEKIKQHLRNCTGGKPLVIPQSAVIEPYYGEGVPTIKVKWNDIQSQRSSEGRVGKLDTMSVKSGVEKGELCFPDDQQYTTEFAHFTVMQLKKCHLTKAGGSRGTCPVGFAGLACTHCAGQPNERRFFYTSADHLRNSFSHIPSHLAECNACPTQVKLRLEELKLIRNRQKSHLKPGFHKIFIDSVWERLHGTPLTDDEDTDDEGSTRPSFSTKTMQRNSLILSKDTTLLVEDLDRGSTSDLAYFTLLQVEPYKSAKLNAETTENQEDSREIRFPGLICRHCMTTPNGRKFFTTSSEHLGGLLLTISDHLKLCKLCPPMVQSQITSYQATHKSQLHILKEGIGREQDAHEMCMQRVWNRLLDASRKNLVTAAPAKVEYKVVNPNMSLITMEDARLVTNYTFFTIQQVRPCNLDNSGNGSRSVFDFGFPGLECIHCAGRPNARRFFYRTSEILAGNYAHIPNHIMACSACPREIKNDLKEKKEAHLLLKHTLPKGSQKQFFELVWDRLHGRNSASVPANL